MGKDMTQKKSTIRQLQRKAKSADEGLEAWRNEARAIEMRRLQSRSFGAGKRAAERQVEQEDRQYVLPFH